MSFDSISNLREDQSLRDKGWVVVDTWTTRMSEDNECGFYCEHPDGHYYTIGITNRNVVSFLKIAVLTFLIGIFISFLGGISKKQNISIFKKGSKKLEQL